MQLVIEIPEEMFDWYDNGFPDEDDAEKLWQIVKNGIPLPKGHGRLIDADAVYKDICDSIEEMTNIGIVVDRQYLWEKLNDALFNALTIIEADTERSRNDTD